MNTTPEAPAADFEHMLSSMAANALSTVTDLLLIVGLIAAVGYLLTAYTAHGKAKATSRRPR